MIKHGTYHLVGYFSDFSEKRSVIDFDDFRCRAQNTCDNHSCIETAKMENKLTKNVCPSLKMIKTYANFKLSTIII